jgi:heme exporter protein D
MGEFLAMGGYGAYVWPAYLFSALTLGGLAAWIIRKAYAARRKLDDRERALKENKDG